MEALSAAPQVKFKIPVTSIRSTAAFGNAIRADVDFIVFAAGLVPVKTAEKYTGPSFHCKEAMQITHISKATKPRRYNKQGPEAHALAADDLTDMDEEDAAEVYDHGCSMGYIGQKEDDDSVSPEMSEKDQKVGDSHDATLRQNILAARKEGRLPAEIKISLLGSTSCFTDEELERMAVDSHLRTGGIVCFLCCLPQNSNAKHGEQKGNDNLGSKNKSGNLMTVETVVACD